MAYPQGPGGPGPVMPLVAYPQPVTPPQGFGLLVLTVNRGPYIIPVTTTARLKIDRRDVRLPGEGTWYIPVEAGEHDVRITDFLGIPQVTTKPVAVHPGTSQKVRFDFGVVRNQAFDGNGASITKFGMISNYVMMGVVLAILILCCCGGGIISSFD